MFSADTKGSRLRIRICTAQVCGIAGIGNAVIRYVSALLRDLATWSGDRYDVAMHILWVITKLFFFLSLVPAVGVLVGFPLFLLSGRIKILRTDRPVTDQHGLVSLVGLG